MKRTRLAPLAALILVPASALAQGQLEVGEELPRKATVGQALELKLLKPPATEEIKTPTFHRSIEHSYRVLYGGKTLEDGEPTLVMHLSHRAILSQQAMRENRATAPTPDGPPQVAIDHEVTYYQFVNPEVISIGGTKLLVLSYDDESVEFVEQ